MRVLAFVNQKGGCGKTTTAVNLAAALAAKGKKVLLIDMDPQAHASIGLASGEKTDGKTIHNLLFAEKITKADVRRECVQVKEKLFLIPSDVTLCALDMELAQASQKDQRLARVVQAIDGEFDFALIDSPPNLGLLTFNVLLAAQELVVPIDMSFLSLYGLGKLLETVELVQEKCAHPLRVYALANHVDKRTCLSREILRHIEERFLEKMIATVVHGSTRIREATGLGIPVVEYEPSSPSALEYLSLAQEIIGNENRIVAEELIRETEMPRSRPEGVQFVYYGPEALQVSVAGDFNLWSQEAHLLANEKGDGFWTCTIQLDPGIYEYKFLVDGEWMLDSNNPRRKENEIGGWNSVVEVTAKEPRKVKEKVA